MQATLPGLKASQERPGPTYTIQRSMLTASHCTAVTMARTCLHCAQVIELLWNLFDLAADTADRVAASSSSATATQQHLQGAAMQGQQQVTHEPDNKEGSQQLEERHHEQASASDEESPGRVAQQLVAVLTEVLQQQAAACSSLQVSLSNHNTCTEPRQCLWHAVCSCCTVAHTSAYAIA